jgi:glyoxylase-like metal-dependent hydrolase (beta-lactamase superfamily II)
MSNLKLAPTKRTTMSDRPHAATAFSTVLYTGYGSPGVAATVGYIHDGDRRVVTDPGMVRHRSVILDPLNALGVWAEQVTDVIFSHHHPDHTLNAALFPNARFHDHWAIYHGDRWHWRDAEGYQLTASVKLIRTPGHTPEDITVLAGTAHGVVAFTHLWNDASSVGDRHAADLEALHAGRRRVLATADLIVPGHGPAFTPGPTTPR